MDILWEGRPVPSFMLHRVGIFELFVRALMLIVPTVFMLVVLRISVEDGASLLDVLFFVPGWFLMVIMACAKFLVWRYRLQRTQYVITSSHVKVLYDNVVQNEWNLDEFAAVDLTIYANGWGRVTFFRPTDDESIPDADPALTICHKNMPRLENIENPQEVALILKRNPNLRLV